MTTHDWAMKWGISLEAFRDLQTTLGTYTPPVPETSPHSGKSEAFVQSLVRLEASRKGVKLFRNNVGALTPKGSNRPVRYGLANDSAEMNAVIKSADLIGFRPLVIQPHHVGTKVAQFVSREAKEVGWQFNPNDEHEAAQWAWASLVLAAGGDACFVTGEGTL